jgi:hypothetical protein
MAEARLIRTEKTPTAVRDEIKALLPPNGKALVMDVTNTAWATTGVDSRVTEWLKKIPPSGSA